MQKTDGGGGGSGADYVAGEGISISGGEISIDHTVVALKADKTKVAESSINGTFDMDFSADNMGSHDFTVNALQLSLRGAYPITSSLSVTGTVGALQWFNDAWSYDRHQDGRHSKDDREEV